jgi:DNA invertase Pin-like site-specific DNA recombinase
MALIGYARVSTREQDYSGQQSALLDAGCERVFAEKISGKDALRTELLRLLDYVRSGDVVVVTRLDRLARNTRDLLDIAEQLQARQVGLRSLAEPWADTTSPAGKMVLTVLAGVAEFERSLILARTTEGRRAALARGKRFGRPRGLSAEQIAQVRTARAGGLTALMLAQTTGVSLSTIYRVLRAKS